MAQFPATIDLSSLDGSNGFKLSGVTLNDHSGRSVASAGDVNGDGFADLIVGAPYADPHGDGSGASYVVFGKASGFAANIDLTSLDGSSGFKLSGVAAYDRSGYSVASAGDVNGDGFADLIVGAFGSNGFSGASYVVFGKASGFAANIDLSGLDGSTGFKLSGVAAYDRSGWSVASAGDVNGDGFADLIVGAFGPNGFSGASYVVFGKAAGFAANIDLSSLDGSTGFKLSGVATGDQSGRSVASAGDVNGDGFADLIVGAPGASSYSGASYVVFGKASGFAADLDLSSLDGSTGFKLSGVAALDRSGYSVASAGDVNGDGFADLIVGAFGASSYSGASYVVFGKASGFAANIDLSSLDGSTGFKLSAANPRSGYSVASAGDVNGDGFADLIVGAYAANYVVFGKASGFAANIDLSSLDGSTGFVVSGTTGYSVASAGDVNGDGFADLIVGNQRIDAPGSDSGASYVIFGRLPDSAVVRIGTVASQTLAGGDLNDTLSGLGGDDTLFGNGGSDTLVGGAGDNIFYGGAGIDVATYASAAAGVAVSLLVAGPQDTGGAGLDRLIDIENLTGSAFADTLTGNDAANTLAGGGGNDFLSGMGGDDTLLLRGSESPTFLGTLDGGAGTDTLLIAGLVDVTAATIAGVEGIRLAGAVTSIVAMTDTQADGLSFTGRAGLIDRAVVHLTGAAATIDYSATAFSEMESFSFWGTTGDDTVTGTAIRDYFNAGNGGADTLTGGDGDDVYRFDQAGVTIVEAADGGTDAVYVSLSYTLADNVENLHQTGSADIQGIGNGLANALFGNGGANDLQGLAGEDRLAGGGGNDTLDGGADSDLLNGDAGDDRLIGGGGRDFMRGGDGADTFVLSNTAGDFQRIIDFAAGTDKLEISEALFGQDFGNGPSLDAAAFRSNATGRAEDADDRFIYNHVTGALFFDADGNGAGARVQIASFNGSPDTLAATDFVLA